MAVTDEHDLGAPGFGVDEEPSELAGTHHRGFIDHDDGAVSQRGGLGAVKVPKQPVKRRRRDARAALELGGGPGCERAADDPERERLACAGDAFHSLYPVTGAAQPPQHAALFGAQRRAGRDHPANDGAVDDGAFTSAAGAPKRAGRARPPASPVS